MVKITKANSIKYFILQYIKSMPGRGAAPLTKLDTYL